MASRAEKPVTVTLGPLTAAAQDRVKSGRYASVSEAGIGIGGLINPARFGR
jgi:hypothetical protein